MNSYTYCTLRYVHDTTTGEFVNVGVAVFSSDARFVGARCRKTFRRVANLFPGLDGDAFKASMRFIERQFRGLQERYEHELPLADKTDVVPIARSVLPADDSSLQWGPLGSGLTKDPGKTLEDLYRRMVFRYERSNPHERRSDEEVWRMFRRELEVRHLDSVFEPKVISVSDDEVDFQYAWKNGVWNCFEPLSFDLSSAENIREKAHRWLGQIISVQAASEPFKVYFLVGAPQDSGLTGAFENALSILRKIPANKEIFLERDFRGLSEHFEDEFRAHERQSKAS